jgi:colanic acid/amylovoran biosynthesis glycosyltransferase
MPKNQAVVFTDKLLPLSQTFVLEQTKHLIDWEAKLIGLESVSNGIDLSSMSSELLFPTGGYFPPRFSSILFKLTQGGFETRNIFQSADLIHAHFAPNGSLMIPVANQYNIPLITTFHGYDILTERSSISARKDLNHAMFARREDELKEKGTLFIAVSNFLMQKAIELGYSESKVRQHYIGVDTESYSQYYNPNLRVSNTIVFVGRLVEKKGVKYLLDAFKIVSKKHPKTKLKIIGDGPMASLVQSAAASSMGNIELLGSRNHHQVLEEINKSAILCVPSCTANDGNSETFGMVFAEAMALGVPVVSSWHGGIPEVISDGVTGFLAAEKNSNEIASHLLTLLADWNLRETMGTAGIERVNTLFDIKKQSKKLEVIYKSLV